jgi:hypothetical protein
MAQTLKTQLLNFSLDAFYSNTNDFSTDTARFLHSWVLSLTNGTGANNANFAWSDKLTITSSSSSTIDLSSLTDRFGNVIAPTKVKLFGVKLVSSTDTAATISIGNAAGNQWVSILAGTNDLVNIRYGGFAVFGCADSTGYAISGTNKDLKILNNSATQSVIVDVVVIGVK